MTAHERPRSERSARKTEPVGRSLDVHIPAGATIVCTIVAKNYLSYARTLMRSLHEFHDDLHLVTLLVDRVDGFFEPAREPFHTLLASDLGIPRWAHMSMKYEITELNTAAKPYLLELLFERFGARNVIYLDPDIVVYRQLKELLELLDSHGVVLTPHILDPLADDCSPGELDFLRVGSYNLGFIALARQGPWQRLLRWWQGKVYTECTRDVERGLFVDQHWMDLAPSLFESVYILRDPGYNLAYWNFKTRNLARTKRAYQVNGHPLVFFHFSGFCFDDIEKVSKHQNRFVLSDLGESYRACFQEYRRRLEANGFRETRKWPYAYGVFPDGVPVSDILRISLRVNDPDGERWPEPYDLHGSDGFRNWATRPMNGRPSRYLSPYALALHQMRRDLQQVFPRPLEGDEEAYARWFVEQRDSSAIFHPLYVDSIAAGLDGSKDAVTADASVAPTSPPPRRSLPAVIAAGGRRFTAALRYHRSYPTHVAPFIPGAAIDVVPDIYTGPGGVYGRLRRMLSRWRILQPVRKLFGMRWILTARYFFSYPHLPETLCPLPAAPNAAVGDPVPLPPPAPPPPARGVNVIGFLHSETGVGEIARKVLDCLDAVGFPVAKLPVRAYDTSRQQDKASHRVGEGTPYGINIFNVNADMTLPVKSLLGEEVYEGRHNIGYWFWELASFPERWRDTFAVYDEIWVASGFVQGAVAARSPVPVVRVPVPIRVELPTTMGRSSLGLPERDFLVLYVFDALSTVERKNPWAAVRAFETAFTERERRERARLVVKVTNLECFPDDARRLREEMRRVNGILLEDYLSREQTNALIAQSDAYLSLHRSEGYGLTIAEAMYLGKPVIATAYSGNMDFMTPGNSYLVPYRLVELERDHPPYDKGNVWAEPDWRLAAEMLRHVFENPDQARDTGAEAARYIRENHDREAVGRIITSRLELVLEHLGGNQGAPPRAMGQGGSGNVETPS